MRMDGTRQTAPGARGGPGGGGGVGGGWAKIARKHRRSAGGGRRLSGLVRGRLAGRQLQLRHQLIVDDDQHFLQLFHILGGEALAHPLDDGVQVGIADAVVVDILLGGAQVVLPAVGGGLDLFHIAFADQAADLIGGVGRRDLHHAGKLGNGGLAHRHDALHAEGFNGGQRGLTRGEPMEHLLIKVQLELGVDGLKRVFQHGLSPFLCRSTGCIISQI